MAFDVGSVIAHIKADTANFQKGVSEVKKSIDGMNKDMVNFSKTAAKGVGIAVGAMGLLGKESIEAASLQQSALMGLETLANAFGQSADDAKKAAIELSRDGLMPVKDSADGLKNLLATGFSLPEAIDLMNGFKDAAAFNRQGTLGFGEAIVGATQGIKNQNSIMVDNAGITKNLSNILVEAGYSQQDLSQVTTDASVRQALYNGILKEASTFQGDAARSADTFQGNMSKLNTEVFNLKVEIGNELLPKATEFIEWVTGTALPKLKELIQVVKDNTDAVIAVAAAITVILLPAFISWAAAAVATAVATLVAAAPLILLAALIGTLVYVWVHNWDTIKANTLAVVDIITNYVRAFATNVTNKFNEIKAWVTNSVQTLRTNINNIWTGLVGDAAAAIQGVYDAFIGKFSELWNKAKEIAGKIRDAIRKAFDKDERDSPSIMDTVGSMVKSANQTLTGVTVPNFKHDIIAGLNAAKPAYVGTSTNGTNIVIDMGGAFISDEIGARKMAEIVGDDIIKKLRQNVRF